MTLNKLVKGCALAVGLTVLATPVMAHHYHYGYEQGRFHSHYYHHRHHFHHFLFPHYFHHHHHHGMRHLFPYPHPHPQLWRDPGCRGKSMTFNYPMVGNHRLDFCYKHDRYCGRAAANAFCRANGYNFAGIFFIDRDVGMTLSVGDHKLRGSRDGFRSINCRY